MAQATRTLFSFSPQQQKIIKQLMKENGYRTAAETVRAAIMRVEREMQIIGDIK